MNDKADNCEPVFDKLVSKIEQPNPTIHELVSRQLASPRLRRLHVDSTLRERMEELRRILAEGGSIYEELSFSLRHNIERTKASRASGMALVPAPMREDADESAQPLDSAGTYRKAARRVPAPRLELGTP